MRQRTEGATRKDDYPSSMELIFCILAGGALGWLACSYLRFNAERGVMVSVLIGAVGGLIGGKAIAPMFSAATASPAAGFSPDALLFAAATAAVCLFAGDRLQRWGM